MFIAKEKGKKDKPQVCVSTKAARKNPYLALKQDFFPQWWSSNRVNTERESRS